MFSTMEMEEYIEYELSGIFQIKLVVKNMMIGSPETHVMYMLG